MNQDLQHFRLALLLLLFFFFSTTLTAQIVPIGDGSYTTTFPGTDAAGRNGFPSGSPQLSGNAVGKPVPTNDWWSFLIKENHVSNLFNYPMALKTTTAGLVVSYIPWGVYDDQEPIVIGLDGLNASQATVADYSDWTVTMDWNDGLHHFQATSGIGMPFLYFNKDTDDDLKITVNLGNVTISNEMLIVENARNNADFVIYAPSGSTWAQNGNDYTSTLNGQNYWSMAMIPLTASNVTAVANEYKEYSYVFPTNTAVNWNYDETSATLTTDFSVETTVKEGVNDQMLIGLLPHQWSNLAASSAQPNEYSYSSVRGEIKTMKGNSFSVAHTFQGILPTLPYVSNYSDGFSVADLQSKVTAMENDGLSTWTDSYNQGQEMNRLIQTARIADKMGNTTSRNKLIATIKERLEDWLSAEASEVAFLFYYQDDWSALLGYPAGHGQDNNLNDHHFHWGYFIHAAAFLEQFEPGWAAQWGEMVNLLIRDASSPNRTDDKFPFLRNFSPYAGHCWANGFATFPQGNDQESTSESMQFHSSLIHWGAVTGDDEIRDLGIYLYTTEQKAIEEYWFDIHERNFSESQQYSLVSRVWGNSYDNGTFWTNDIAASYGIEFYPIHGGSLYLGHHADYLQKLWSEIENNTGILTNEANPNLWHDVYWQVLAFRDPEKAIQLYDSYPERAVKFGVSDAQTYYWLHAMNALGTVDVSVTADNPLATVFVKDGERTYVAHNYTNNQITVNFSDGFALMVPANSMATNRDANIAGTLTSSFETAYAYGSVDLSLNIQSGTPDKVAFYDGNELLGEVSQAPYTFKADNLVPQKHHFYAKIIEGDFIGASNVVSVLVGNQTPFGGNIHVIPGTIEAGHYDEFEGGSGQGISYSDVNSFNEGDFRTDEGVDAVSDANEGATVGWISSGEWLEYSIDVQQAGMYNMNYRFASDINTGGGPFQLELDGEIIANNLTANYTSGWDKWASLTATNLPLPSGEHILRVYFLGDGFNLGKMAFTYQADLPYSQPVADAGEDIVLTLPSNSTDLDGSASSDPDGGTLTYAWEQLNGPSVITFSDPSSATPNLSDLEEGFYQIRLTVSNGNYSDTDELLLIVSSQASFAPNISLTAPKDGDSFLSGQSITLSANASDLDGTVSQVAFFADGTQVGVATSEPYEVNWTAAIGTYKIHAQATDNDGNTNNSDTVEISFTPAPSCEGTAHNGDFNYKFSDDAANPTLTFIPSVSGVGSPTCILYYGTSPNGPYPGYGVTPNEPFTLTASAGTTIYFYYTYSYPNQGEKNTADHIISYVVGTCQDEVNVSLTLANATVSIDENSLEGTSVTNLSATYTGTQPLTYSIVSGNNAGAFQMNSSTGEITVVDSIPLDYETTPSFSLGVEVTDGDLTDQATITINLNDVDETVTGLNPEEIGLRYYPNPTQDKIKIAWPEFQSASIHDLLGRKLVETNDTVIDLSQVESGVYILTLTGRVHGKVSVKIIKK